MNAYSSYGYKKIPATEKSRLILDHFESIAWRYDLADNILSFGLHFFWRRRAIRRLGIKPGDTVLDLCAGTGDFAILSAKSISQTGKVVALDISRMMMLVGQQKAAKAGLKNSVYWIQGDAERMSFARQSFDAVIVGYGIRNFVFLERGLREIYRVLKPAGKFIAMEFSLPRTAWIRFMYHYYSFKFMPWAGRLITGSAEPFQYLAESIRVFPSPVQVRKLLTTIGFVNVSFERLSNGLAALYSGEKSEQTQEKKQHLKNRVMLDQY